MGNAQTQQNIGDFQQGVGQVTSTLGLISAYFVSFILCLFAAGFLYVAVTPLSLQSIGSNQPCTTTQDCTINKSEECQSNFCNPRAGPKERHWAYLFGVVICLAIALFIVYMARKMNEIAYSSRGGAQAIGMLGEVNLLRDI